MPAHLKAHLHFYRHSKPNKKMQKSHQANAQRHDSSVQGSSSVFQMNICAMNPPLRKAENRYG